MGTHTETYRRFLGARRTGGLRFWPVTTAAIRVGISRKLPLVLLYAMPAASMFIFSFLVYSKYAIQEGSFAEATELGGLEGSLVGLAASTIEVKRQIATFNLWSRLFALLAIAWYGAGLFADDRRQKAHLLYFARPLTRLDYALGKFLCLAFFGALAVLVPGLVICLTAVFSSPDWSFLIQESGTILATLGYGSLWVLVLSLLVLAVSSVATRKSFALMGTFGCILVPNVASEILRVLLDEPAVRALSPWTSFRRIANHLFPVRWDRYEWPVAWSYAVIAAFGLLSLVVIAWRMRRLEAVA